MAIAIVGIGLVAPFIGGLILRDNLTTWFWLGAAADVAIAVGVGIAWCIFYPRLRRLEKDA